MSTAPNTTWQDQLRSLLDRYGKFGTRDDAYRALTQMANVAEQYIAEHPTTDSHTPLKEMLRSSLQGYLGGDRVAYGKLLHIAELADKQEVVAKKGGISGGSLDNGESRGQA
jgi:hypothetical protein